MRVLTINSPVNDDEFKSKSEDQILQLTLINVLKIIKISHKIYRKQKPFHKLKTYLKKSISVYKNIVIPFTDGIKTLQVNADLEESVNTDGAIISKSIEKGVTLAIIDEVWKEHPREMDDLSFQSVQNVVYEQKDPLLIYKFEAIDLFKSLMTKSIKILFIFIKASIYITSNDQIKEETNNLTQENFKNQKQRIRYSRSKYNH